MFSSDLRLEYVLIVIRFGLIPVDMYSFAICILLQKPTFIRKAASINYRFPSSSD